MHKSESHQRSAAVGVTSEVMPAATEEVLVAYLKLSVSGHRTQPVVFSGRIDPVLEAKILTLYDTAFVYDERRDVTTML